MGVFGRQTGNYLDKVHAVKRGTKGPFTACGRLGFTTTRPERVTCKQCTKRTGG